MEWHNFKVFSIYGVIVCVFLFIIGEGEFAILPIIVYPFCGLWVCIKEFRKKKKLASQFEDVPEHIKHILICHIMKRSPKLKKRIENDIKWDISNNNYQVASSQLVQKDQVEPSDADADSDYYLLFDNNDRYHVYRNTYETAKIGDRLWVVATPTNTMRVIQSGNNYYNMFIYGMNHK